MKFWISLRSRPEATHFLQSNGLCRKACQDQLHVRNADGVTSLAWHAVFMQHGKHCVHMVVLRWTRFEWSAIRDAVILPLTPNHLGQNKLNYLPSLKAKTEVFPGEASSVLQNKKFLENSLVPQSRYRTLSGKFSEADSTPISFTRYRSESCDITDIAGNPAHCFCLGLHLQRDPNYASCYKNPATIIPTWRKTRSLPVI